MECVLKGIAEMLLRTARECRNHHRSMADVEYGVLHRNFGGQYLARRFCREIEVRHHDDKTHKDARQEGKTFHMTVCHGIHRKAAENRRSNVVGMSLNIRRQLQEILTVEGASDNGVCRSKPRHNRRCAAAEST